MKKAIGYVRVSTEEQAREGVSLDNQKAQIEKYIEYKGFELTGMIEDAGISGGKNRSREGFVELLGTIEAGQVDVVIIYSLERLSRDMLTLLSLEKYLDEYDVELHEVTGQIDTGTATGFMNFAMKAFIGEMERRTVKERTRKAMQFKKGNAEIVGPIPYGYENQAGKLVEVESEQRVIKLVNERYQRGARLVDIARELKERGKFTRRGRNFTSAQVLRIIKGYKKVNHRQSKMGAEIKKFILKVA